VEEIKEKILKVLRAIPQGVLYSTTDWHRLLDEDKREIRHALDELEAENRIEIIKSEAGRSDKPLYRLKEVR
jgi:TRAP-type C4-dicarboxylate transport system substrate-binding protein